ncbi:MAG TPA: class I SAM-dependent methyltransferase [Rubrobacteraceae bacterium]|nr:class I SAM-dependent methyltransferase [Rubrobacteraceae bacterium]
MRGVFREWFLSNDAGWDPRSYERYFGTPLGAAFRDREERVIFEFVGNLMRPRHSVLEVGCGTGNYTVPLARRCAEITAVDSSPEMRGYLRERLIRERVTGVEIRPGRLPDDLGALRGFDGVLSVGVLNYVEDLAASLRSLAAPLKPGGWIVFTVPLRSVEGGIYAAAELANRRRIYPRTFKEVSALTGRAGLKILESAAAGLTRSGLTLVVAAVERAGAPGAS